MKSAWCKRVLRKAHFRNWSPWAFGVVGSVLFACWWVDWQTIPQPTLYAAFLASLSRVLSVLFLFFVMYLVTRPLPDHINQALSGNAKYIRLLFGPADHGPQGVLFPLMGEGVVIGRGRECDMVVNDSYVSHRHCRVWLDRGRVLLEDLGSRNGTWIGKIRIGKQPIALESSCVILLGGKADGVRFVLVEEA